MKRLHFMDLVTYFATITIILFLTSLFFLDTIKSLISNSSNLFILSFIIFLIEILPQPIGPEAFILSSYISDVRFYLVLIIAFSAIIITSIINFNIGKLFYHKVCSGGRCDKHLSKFQKYDKIILLVSALGPIPYVPFCWLSGSANMKKKEFISYGIIPRLIRVVIISSLIYLF